MFNYKPQKAIDIVKPSAKNSFEDFDRWLNHMQTTLLFSLYTRKNITVRYVE